MFVALSLHHMFHFGMRREHACSSHKLRNHLQVLCDANYLERDGHRKAMIKEAIESTATTLETLFSAVRVEYAADCELGKDPSYLTS